MEREISPLERARLAYRPRLPQMLARGPAATTFSEGPPSSAVRDEAQIRQRFPRTFGRPLLRLAAGTGGVTRRPVRVGVVLSGGQAPGGHNVIAGLLDGLQAVHEGSELIGFRGGPRGILTGSYDALTVARVDPYRNTGGFDLIGSGRDKIETEQQLADCRATCERLSLDGLVIVGGDDSNTNAALLAEYFLARDVKVAVTGVPKTIDGDLTGEHVEISFGFDTATKLYAELIGNICRDAGSARKYWHFVKLMGRSASHVTLECALRTRANIALIGEEVEQRSLTLRQVVDGIAEVIQARAQAGRAYGVCLVPEGLIEFVPEIRALIAELNAMLGEHAGSFQSLATFAAKQRFVAERLSPERGAVFGGLPERIQSQLLLERDAHGNVQVSKIDTEQLLTELVGQRLAEQRAAGRFPGKFQVQAHFLGYEGRCAAPSNFDADYTYALGHLAAMLCASGRSGYLCGIEGLAGPPAGWRPLGVPLTSMMQIETRKGRPTPVIGKSLVRTDGAAFAELARRRDRWQLEDEYLYPGPIQYFGPAELCDTRPLTLTLERPGAGA